jgi:hypothetical protein
MISLNGSLCG